MIGTRKGLTHGRETSYMNIGCITCLRYRLLIHVWRLSSMIESLSCPYHYSRCTLHSEYIHVLRLSSMSESLFCPYHYSRWSFQREFRSARVTTLYTIHLHIHTYMYPYIHTYMHAYIHTYIHTNLHTNIHTYIQTNIHTYIHTYTHTYIHTYIQQKCIWDFWCTALSPFPALFRVWLSRWSFQKEFRSAHVTIPYDTAIFRGRG